MCIRDCCLRWWNKRNSIGNEWENKKRHVRDMYVYDFFLLLEMCVVRRDDIGIKQSYPSFYFQQEIPTSVSSRSAEVFRKGQ